ncbi:transcriptional regulator GcvA [Endozoicomonas elysicola]|uniref:HTH lysR-type domain-containing protein n=1 Tax=Endozoicomonas elysicola TaxID=305900 RepID=A0A081K6S6_9GAMM|nr:transcriptional regulator GcvA [Endozoicomonas elysicola]KEI69852.1 hypothetical protein GV64_03035 [Endozoicomonas elysicola]
MARPPSLKGLRTFEVVARHLSFTRAADELNITQAAVSQQIRNLEEELGIPLFRRTTRQLHLSDNGERLLIHVQKAFRELEKGLNKVRTDRYHYLNISVLPSFASRWLIPRLGQFSQKHPDIEIRLLPSLALTDFSKEDIDLAIRFGAGNYPGVSTEFLMEEKAFPVCRPDFFSTDNPEIHELDGVPLLQDAGVGAITWREWLDQAGGTQLDVRYGTQITDAGLLLDLARTGHGVALSRASLVKDDLDKGLLIKPFELVLESSFSYYLVSRPNSQSDPRIRVFSHWLKQACEEFNTLTLSYVQ